MYRKQCFLLREDGISHFAQTIFERDIKWNKKHFAVHNFVQKQIGYILTLIQRAKYPPPAHNCQKRKSIFLTESSPENFGGRSMVWKIQNT